MRYPLLLAAPLLAALAATNAGPAQPANDKSVLQKTEAKRPAAEPAILKAYNVPSGKAEVLSGLLQCGFRNNAEVKIVASSRQEILVWGPFQVHLEIARQLQGMSEAYTEVIPLATLPAVRTVATLKAMLGPVLYLEADQARNAIIVRGAREQIRELKSILGSLGEAPSTARMRIFALERDSAQRLADALELIVGRMRPHSVRVNKPVEASATTVSVPAKGGDAGAKKLPKHPPLTLTAVGNKLVATCDDPEILALVQELTRLLTKPAHEGDFEIIRLRFAKAKAVAKVLGEALNGPTSDKGPKRVRIVADLATNSLLVRASPLDLFTIRHLLKTALDTDAGAGETETAAQTFVVGPLKHARAGDMAKLLGELYRTEGGRPEMVVTADPRTNTLLLRGSAALLRDIQRLVTQLDVKTAEK
jgi:type II secretory pathway component GspD/PulD (secretin)